MGKHKGMKKHADGEMAGGSQKESLTAKPTKAGKVAFTHADGDMGSGSVDAPMTWDQKRDASLSRK